ncbi:sigma factor [Nocardia wallacei]|uniref:sigma factor n=1 Tax=Nocardia wallacei TaxID=480035 RepID=UPI0024559472|nr:sigma factor [Nocardia wallacei]
MNPTTVLAPPALERDLAALRQPLFGYCYRMLGSALEAEDAVQETMMRAWRSAGGLADPAGLRPWVYRIATNVCIDAAGERRRRAMPVYAAYWPDLFPGFLAVGAGVGLSLVSIQVAAFVGIPEAVSGLAGGMVETAREIGGALGTAVVAAVAIAVARGVSEGGAQALTEGFRRGSLVAACFSLVAVLAAVTVVRRAERSTRRTAAHVAAAEA